MLDAPLVLVFPAAMAFAAAMDLVSMTIPNRISIVLVAVFAVAASVAGLDCTSILTHLAAGATVLIIGIALFSMGWVGGGDVKLIAAGALWLGPQTFAFLVITGICGSLLTLVMLCFRAYPAAALPIPDWAVRLHQTATGMPYGLAIAAGGLFTFPHSEMFRSLLGI